MNTFILERASENIFYFCAFSIRSESKILSIRSLESTLNARREIHYNKFRSIYFLEHNTNFQNCVTKTTQDTEVL